MRQPEGEGEGRRKRLDSGRSHCSRRGRSASGSPLAPDWPPLLPPCVKTQMAAVGWSAAPVSQGLGSAQPPGGSRGAPWVGRGGRRWGARDVRARSASGAGEGRVSERGSRAGVLPPSPPSGESAYPPPARPPRLIGCRGPGERGQRAGRRGRGRPRARPSRGPSAAVSGPSALRNVAGSARWRRGRAAGRAPPRAPAAGSGGTGVGAGAGGASCSGGGGEMAAPSSAREGSAAIPLRELSAASRLPRPAQGPEEPLPSPVVSSSPPCLVAAGLWAG